MCGSKSKPLYQFYIAWEVSAYSFLLKVQPGSCTSHFRSHSIEQNYVMCLYLATRRSRKTLGRLLAINHGEREREKERACERGREKENVNGYGGAAHHLHLPLCSQIFPKLRIRIFPTRLRIMCLRE